MANNTIQIKRSPSTAQPASLNPGELAYSNAVGGSGVLYIGDTSGTQVIAIGGVRHPGTLTANQALVANSTSGIDRVYAANVDLSYLGANGSQGTSGYILFSGGTSSNAYWGSVGSLSINVNSTYAWTNTQSYSNTITFNGPVVLGNTVSANGSVGTAGYALLSGGPGSNLYWSSVAGLGVNTAAQYTWGNTQTFNSNVALNANVAAASNTLLVFGSYSEFSNTIIITANGWNNATPTVAAGPSIALGWNSAGGGGSFAPATPVVANQSFVNTSLFFTGNTTQYIKATGGTVTLGNTGTSATINSTIYTGTANNASYLGGTAAASYQIAGANINIGTWGGTANAFIANSSFVGWGNNSANVVLSWDATGQDIFSIAGNINNYVEAVIYNVNGQSSASADFSINDNLGPYSNNYIDIGINSTGWANTQWTINGPSDAYVYTGNTNLAVGTSATSNLVFFTGGTLAANERARITSGGNVGINNTNPSHTLSVNGNTYIGGTLNVVGSATFANASFVNMNVSGNLVVSGSVVTVNTATLQVNDNVIEIGFNNGVLSTDLIDTGIYSPSNTGGTLQYSGIARIAASSTTNNPWYKIFSTTTNPNSGLTISSSTTGQLQAYLYPYGLGGAFVANSTVVNITANASVSSTLVANSLTLTTALLATYGGTGVNTYAAGDILYAGGANPTALSKLSVPGSAANGQVLMITNNLPAYGTLDGGTF